MTSAISLAALLVFPAICLGADVLEGKITAVLSGDTVSVTDQSGKAHRFRFLGADAPEQWQRRYRESLKKLKTRYLGKKVTVEWLRMQVCSRGKACVQLAKVLAKGEDLGLHQIETGFAWHDRRQIREQSTTDKTLYSDAELQARSKRRGLWADTNPIAPWESAPRKFSLDGYGKKSNHSKR